MNAPLARQSPKSDAMSAVPTDQDAVSDSAGLALSPSGPLRSNARSGGALVAADDGTDVAELAAGAPPQRVEDHFSWLAHRFSSARVCGQNWRNSGCADPAGEIA